MKKTLIGACIILIMIWIANCTKNNHPDDNKNNGEVTDTTQQNHNHTDTINNPGGNTNSDSTNNQGNNTHTDTISNPGNTTDTIPSVKTNKKDTVVLTFHYGEDGPSADYKNIYVIWMEAPNFIQNMYICQKLIKGGLTGTALPYWKVNKYPSSSEEEVDAVTAATKGNCDFTVTSVIKDSTLKNLTINFETDRSFDPNDWFDNQPALLYQASINLEDTTHTYELQPVGWTPNEGTENQVANTPMGKLQSEMKYITNFKKGKGFGDKDSRGATKMVKNITVVVK